MLASQLRAGRCESDTERTVARWLRESGGNWDTVEKASGIRSTYIKEWVRSLGQRSELRKFL